MTPDETVVQADPYGWKSLRTLLLVAGFLLVMAVAAEFLQPIALAVLLAFILDPVVRRLDRLGLPRALGVVLTLLLVFAVIGGLGYVVGRQLGSLTDKLPQYESNIERRLAALRPREDSAVGRVTKMADHVRDSFTEPETIESVTDTGPDPVPVKVVDTPDSVGQLQTLLGPFQHAAAFLGMVLLLLFFLLLNREDIGDRIVQISGRGRISLTTKTLAQIGRRLSRYLATFALVNASFGAIIGVSLAVMGLPYAVLWGVLAGVLRFIPYLGPITAFALPTAFAFAQSEGWALPLAVVGLYAVAEIVANSVEPFIYGRSVGISSLGLLVAALFWTWLWGPIGLLMATPLTVCLTVLGQFVPDLRILSAMLGEEVEVEEDLRWYQRVLHRDREGALKFLDEALEKHGAAKVFDQIVLPALSRADQDFEAGQVDHRDLAALWSTVQGWLDDLAERDEFAPGPPATPAGAAPPP